MCVCVHVRMCVWGRAEYILVGWVAAVVLTRAFGGGGADLPRSAEQSSC